MGETSHDDDQVVDDNNGNESSEARAANLTQNQLPLDVLSGIAFDLKANELIGEAVNEADNLAISCQHSWKIKCTG